MSIPSLNKESTDESLILKVIGEGESFGELALINKSVRAATVKTNETSHFLTVDK